MGSEVDPRGSFRSSASDLSSPSNCRTDWGVSLLAVPDTTALMNMKNDIEVCGQSLTYNYKAPPPNKLCIPVPMATKWGGMKSHDMFREHRVSLLVWSVQQNEHLAPDEERVYFERERMSREDSGCVCVCVSCLVYQIKS